MDNMSDSKLTTIQYREEEAFYLKSEGDRLIVVYSIIFRDADDVVISKIFLQVGELGKKKAKKKRGKYVFQKSHLENLFPFCLVLVSY